MSDEPMTPAEADPVGPSDIARRARVQPTTVQAWRTRHQDFPPPRWRVSGVDVWHWPDVDAWLAATADRRATYTGRRRS